MRSRVPRISHLSLGKRELVGKGLALVAVAALAAGYADLIRGGITLGPILLVFGYCVLVPAAIW